MKNPKSNVTRLPVQHRVEQAPRDYLEYRLLAAAETYDETPVEGAGEALAAVTEHLRLLGTAHPAMAPLEALLSAIHDVRQGTANPMLQVERRQGRPALTTGEKALRCAAVALVESMRRRKIRTIDEGCRIVARWVVRGGGKARAKDIAGWRKDVLAHRSDAFNADGYGLDMRQHAKRWIEMLSELPMDSFDTQASAWLEMRLRVK